MSAEAVQAAVSERFPQAATAAEPSANEFVIFSKPELGRLSEEDTAKVWDLFATSFASHAVTVHRVKIMTGPELDTYVKKQVADYIVLAKEFGLIQ